MKPNIEFLNQPKNFWAFVRSISEKAGYTERGTNQVKILTLDQAIKAIRDRGLGIHDLITPDLEPTQLGKSLVAYFKYRADILNEHVEQNLMNADRAREIFYNLKGSLNPTCPLPMNKQKGDKKAPAYFTGIINMLIESNIGTHECDYNPRQLTTITRNNSPLRTMARWVDGAFPSTVDPIAIWEIKEYYYTTTFGSRIADSVYETLLDGLELEELQDHEGVEVKHYLMVDAYLTWWEMGKSYLCRMVDMLHMGYVDEILFGYEVVDRLPILVKEWIEILTPPGLKPHSDGLEVRVPPEE